MEEKIKVGLVEFVYQVISKYETKYYLSFKKKTTLNDLHINKTIQTTYCLLWHMAMMLT